MKKILGFTFIAAIILSMIVFMIYLVFFNPELGAKGFNNAFGVETYAIEFQKVMGVLLCFFVFQTGGLVGYTLGEKYSNKE